MDTRIIYYVHGTTYDNISVVDGKMLHLLN